MLSSHDLLFNAFAVLVLIPLAVYSMITKQLLPPETFMGKVYRAEPHMLAVGNALLLVIGLRGALLLMAHYGILASGIMEKSGVFIGVPFLVLAVTELLLFGRGALKVKQRRLG